MVREKPTPGGLPHGPRFDDGAIMPPLWGVFSPLEIKKIEETSWFEIKKTTSNPTLQDEGIYNSA